MSESKELERPEACQKIWCVGFRRAGSAQMTSVHDIAQHWDRGDVYGAIVTALARMSKPLDRLTLEDLAPVDHFHARGLPATIDLADSLSIAAGQRILDIGCGLGGPARYIARRFQCAVSGIDITASFVDTANKLTALLHMDNEVDIRRGDALDLPYGDLTFSMALTRST
jgi:SAM-dependent methyltransferase